MPSDKPSLPTGFGDLVLETMLRNAPFGFAFLDRELRFILVNDRLGQMNGVPAEAHIGRHVGEIVPSLAETAKRVTDQIVATGEPVLNHEFAGETQASGGQPRWWCESWYPVYDSRGALIGFGAIVEDITERRLAEAAVAAARERRRRALSIETVGRLVYKLDGRILEANAAFERMCGYTVDELRAMPYWDALTAPEFLGATARAAKDLAIHGKTAAYEKQMIRKDGSRFWGLFSPTRVAGEGQASECVEFIIDITHSKEIEQELREADRRKNEFLATLAHELRNPMAPLKNGLHIVRLSSAPESTAQNVIEMMDRQLNHLVRLVDDLLDIGRITSGKVELKRSPIELREILARSIEASRVTIDAHRHELEVDEGKERLFVHGDMDRLAQVFSNLLSNAAKYTDDGGRINVTIRREGGAAVVRVSDTGIGIPAEDLLHVFDLFSQVRVHQGRTEGGLGIGLALAQQLVAMHGGSISVESAGLRKGTAFTVRLPLTERAADTPDYRPSLEALQAGRRLRILVADDNADVLGSLALLLELQGHEVVAVSNGMEALAAAGGNEIDVALLDIGMPTMDGIETARRLREMPEGRNMRLIAVTGWGQERDRKHTREAGFDAHLVKPVDPLKLGEILRGEPVRGT